MDSDQPTATGLESIQVNLPPEDGFHVSQYKRLAPREIMKIEPNELEVSTWAQL